jgi:hypothetical protein
VGRTIDATLCTSKEKGRTCELAEKMLQVVRRDVNNRTTDVSRP